MALWCLLSLTSEATQAHCLDYGGDCSPSAAVPLGSCHDQASETDIDPGCGSCIDILVPQDTSAVQSRPDHDLRAPAPTPAIAATSDSLFGYERAVATAATALIEDSPLHPLLRTTVLRI